MAHDQTESLLETDTLHTLRVRVLNVSMTLLAIALPLASVTLIVNAAALNVLTRRAVLLAGSMIVFPGLWAIRHRLGFRRSAISLVTVLALTAFVLASRGGLTVGYAALCVLTIQLAALFFGRRGAALGLGAVVLLHLTAWVIVAQNIGPPLQSEMWDPHGNALWLRHLVVLGLLGLVIALGELYVVEQLAHSLVEHQQLAARDKEQQLALERSRRIEALARVAGGVAHDFNNALTVILGTAEAAKFASTSSEDVELYMDEIMEAAQRAAGLTNQLLTLGRQQLSTPTNVSVTALLSRLRPAISRVLPSDISLVIDMPTDDVTVCVDETGLDRAVLNLVLNARDAMPRGGSITVSCRRDVVLDGDAQVAPGAYVAMTVTDNGVGMDQETLERIFDPFFTTKGEKGTGLGLSSVYAFAKEAKGAVDVTSSPGNGTAFTVRIPEVSAALERAVEDRVTDRPAIQRRFGRVLVAEDRDDVRSTMTRALSHYGFEVSEARTGDEALQVLADRDDVALMCIDGVMPGLSTAETIERARAMAPRMRIIVCSGHVQEDLLRRGIEAGRYEFLPKPFSPQELVARVRRALTVDAKREV